MTAWIALGWAATVGPIIGLSGLLAWMRTRSRRKDDALVPAVSFADGFSMERYLPMERLLSKEEFVFLTRMPGYRDEIGKKWKRDRRRLFRLYLNELAGDFEALHGQARRLAASVGAPGGSIIGLLIKQKIAFWRALAVVDLHLALDAAGVGSVNPRPLLELVESMCNDLELALPDKSSYTPA